MSLRYAAGVFVVASWIAACSGGAETHDKTTAEGGKGGAGGAGGQGGAGGGGGLIGGAGGATTTTTKTTSGSTSSGSTSSSSGSSTSSSGSPDAGDYDCSVAGTEGKCMDVTECAVIGNHVSTPGFCPGPADIQCCTLAGGSGCDPDVLVFPNDGDTTEEPGEGGCPNGMIRVTSYCVDRYEATLVRGDDGTSWSPFFNPGDVPMIAVSVAGTVPQGYIDGVQAGEACLNAGKRLCTDAEWLRACRGPSNTTYPYGNTKMLGVCNDHRDVHPAVEYFGTSASWIWSQLDNACIDQLHDSVDATGENAGCVTYEGAYDMMGNLHEWTADPAGTFRGGYYVDTVINGSGCLYATTAHNTLHWDYSTGFRCCAEP